MLKYFFAGLAILAVGGLIALIYLQTRPKADEPTRATAGENLVLITLPDSLKPMPVQVKDGPASNASFSELIKEAVAADRIINGGTLLEDQQQAAKSLAEELEQSITGGKYSPSFGDEMLPEKAFNDAALQTALSTIRKAVRLQVDELTKQEQYEQAHELAMACYELGRRLFLHNTRLRVRQYGLTLMKAGLGQSRLTAQAELERGKIDQEGYEKQIKPLDDWLAEIRTIEMGWLVKLQAIDTPKPNVGDLVRVAEQDQDLTFRIFATRRLGFARFEHGEQTNAAKISAALDRAAQSDEKRVQIAAKAGQELTADEFHSALR